MGDFSFDDIQVDLLCIVLSKMVLTLAENTEITQQNLLALQAKAIADIERVVNNELIADDPRQEWLPLQ